MCAWKNTNRFRYKTDTQRIPSSAAPLEHAVSVAVCRSRRRSALEAQVSHCRVLEHI